MIILSDTFIKIYLFYDMKDFCETVLVQNFTAEKTLNDSCQSGSLDKQLNCPC